MLRPAYLKSKLIPPIATKDGGVLRTVEDARAYMLRLSKEREQRRHWQESRKLILEEADGAAVSWQLRIALLKDGKLDLRVEFKTAAGDGSRRSLPPEAPRSAW